MKMKNLLLVIIATLGLTASTMAQNLPNYVPANGLVGWWPFNGNANDESGNGSNGTVNGATPTTDRHGNENSAYNFIKINNDYISINNTTGNFGEANFTITIWCLYSSTSAFSSLINKRYNEVWGNWWELKSDVFGINEANNGNNYSFINNTLNTVNVWQHAVIVREGNNLKYYVNGLLIGNTITPIIHNISNTNDLIIGSVIAPISGILQSHDGKIDDIGIWNRALTEQEITALYNASNCSSNSAINPQINSLSTGSTATFNATTSDPNPSYVWQSNLGQGFQTLNDLENYSGTNTSSLSIANVQLSEHNQPIRVITTSGECVDTSDIATISILDTCVTSINDTTFITVTDTLVINTLITGINPPNNSNTIKVYPNPSNSHITIEYGDFAIMNGYQLRIENSLGQEVFQTSITQESDYLNLNSWGGNGLYFVHIVDPQGNTIDIRKIVLQ